MKILNNSLIGRNFKKFGLTLNDEGLHRNVRVPNKTGYAQYNIFLTKDINVICEIMGMSVEDFQDEANIVFAKLYTNPFFWSHIFDTQQDSEAYHIAEYAKWLSVQRINGINLPEVERVPIRTVRVEEIIGVKYNDRVGVIKRLIKKGGKIYKTKFEAMKEVLLSSGYNIRNFQADIERLKESFVDKMHMTEYFDNHTPEELADRLRGTKVNQE